MDDLITPYLTLQRLTRELYEQVNKKNFLRAYEISVDMVDLAQQMEDISKRLLDAKMKDIAKRLLDANSN